MGAYAEQQARERIMAAYIKTDPVYIVLFRPVFTETEAGGRIQAGYIELPSQEFFFMPFKRRLSQEDTFNPQSFGEDRTLKVEYIFICMPEIDVQEDDYFDTVDGRLDPGAYTVEFVSHRQWDRRQVGIKLR